METADLNSEIGWLCQIEWLLKLTVRCGYLTKWCLALAVEWKIL